MSNFATHLDDDTLATHAIDALPPDELIAAGMHLAVCEACRQRLASFQATAALLPYGLAPAAPSPGLRERIVAQARASRQGRPLERPAPTQTSARLGRSWWGRLMPLLGALLLILGILVGRAFPAAPNDPLREPGAQSAALTGQGTGLLLVAPQAGKLRLSIDQLPPLVQGQVYQLWLIGGSAPISAGVFTVDAEGNGQIEMSGVAWSPLYTGIAITAEPGGGSSEPTSPIVAQAAL